MPSQNRQLAAIMFTDIVGYTRLMGRDEDKAFKILEINRTLHKDLLISYNGHLLKEIGDGMLCNFNSASQAVKCAVELIRKSIEYRGLKLRIGIHIGEVVFSGNDVFGDGVNITSRIEGLAVPNSVLISGKVYDEIKNKHNIKTRFLGTVQLKNDSKPRDIYAVANSRLKIPKSKDLHNITEDKPELQQGAINSLEQQKRSQNKNRLKLPSPKVGVSLLFAMMVLAFGGFLLISLRNNAKLNWARDQAPAEIQQLIDQSKDWDAFRLWKKATSILPESLLLKQIEQGLARKITVNSEPAGVSIFRKPVQANYVDYEFIGKTPIENIPVYGGPSIWMLACQGYDTIYKLASPNVFDEALINMSKTDEIPSGMVKIGKSNNPIRIPGIDHIEKQEIEEFFVDKFEVTNKSYKEFVENGGYKNPDFWKHIFVKGGREISFSEAMSYLQDKTDHPGPAGWEVGYFPDGKANYPVTGISWYEAAAYAEYAQKMLPTIYHWNVIATTWYSELIVPYSNLSSNGIAQVGFYNGMSSNGIYDIAGNAREWCFNASNRNGEHFILGGAWSDAQYAFTDAGTANPWDRSLINGFRCIKYVDINEDQEHLKKRIDFYHRDFLNEPIVTDSEFELIKRQFEFDRTPLNPQVKEIEVTSSDWSVEEITFDAAYMNEKMSAFLYLPKYANTPLQTVIYFPGSDVILRDKFDAENTYRLQFLNFIIKSGRAVLFPIFQSTYERDDEIVSDYPNESNYYKERFIMWGKDLKRSIDYLETRPDINSEKLAYFGHSWGAANGALMGAIEPRLKCLILSCGGLYMQPSQKEADLINYLPRVHQPVLMLNGKHDMFYPLKSSQFPMFELLGTDPKHKKHKTYEVNHLIPRDVLLKEVLSWLDTYLGFVDPER